MGTQIHQWSPTGRARGTFRSARGAEPLLRASRFEAAAAKPWRSSALRSHPLRLPPWAEPVALGEGGWISRPMRVSLVMFVGMLGLQLMAQTRPVAGQESTEPSDRSSRSASRMPSGHGQSRQASVEAKLEQILKNQRMILEKNEAVKEEVRVIQVRATSRASVQP